MEKLNITIVEQKQRIQLAIPKHSVTRVVYFIVVWFIFKNNLSGRMFVLNFEEH